MYKYNADKLLSNNIIQFFQQHKAAKIISILSTPTNIPRIIGGAVRDAILGKPIKDIDIATCLLPEIVVKMLKFHSIQTVDFGARFGNICAIYENEKIEITTLRKDIKCFGRDAEVEFTDDYCLDAQRRDFTINSLSYCIQSKKIFDYCGGINDLLNKRVKFIGNPQRRIKEDYLRIMRYFRFASEYTNSFDEKILALCIENISSLLPNVSTERVLKELDLILKLRNNPIRVLEILQNHGILGYILSFSKITFSKELKQTFDMIYCDQMQNIIQMYGIDKKLLTYSSLFISNEIKNPIKNFTKKTNNALHRIIKNYEYAIKIKTKKFDNKILLFIWSRENNFTHFACSLILFCIKKQIQLNFINKYLKYFFTKEQKKIPVSGKDLIDKVSNKNQLGILLERIHQMWAYSNFTLSKEELLCNLKLEDYKDTEKRQSK